MKFFNKFQQIFQMSNSFHLYLNYETWILSRKESCTSVCLTITPIWGKSCTYNVFCNTKFLYADNYKPFPWANIEETFAAILLPKLVRFVFTVQNPIRAILFKKCPGLDYDLFSFFNSIITEFRQTFTYDDQNDAWLKKVYEFLKKVLFDRLSSVPTQLFWYLLDLLMIERNDESAKQEFINNASVIVLSNSKTDQTTGLIEFLTHHKQISTICFTAKVQWLPKDSNFFALFENIRTVIDYEPSHMRELSSLFRLGFLSNLETIGVYQSDLMDLVDFCNSLSNLKHLSNLTIKNIETFNSDQIAAVCVLLRKKVSIRSLQFSPGVAECVSHEIAYCLYRNNLLTWHEVHPKLFHFCIALYSLHDICWFPPYVLLEIFDWLPVTPSPIYKEYANVSAMHFVPEIKKVGLIESVSKSVKKIVQQREKTISKN